MDGEKNVGVSGMRSGRKSERNSSRGSATVYEAMTCRG